MAISYENVTPLPYQEGGLVTNQIASWAYLNEMFARAMGVTGQMVADYYEQNWELSAMHCSGDDYDEGQVL